jgi:hypothetical protein
VSACLTIVASAPVNIDLLQDAIEAVQVSTNTQPDRDGEKELKGERERERGGGGVKTSLCSLNITQ